ncbi:MAG TPA: hypothetical protein VKB39_02585 [Candidatus Baltobacteraceae bacterium]|nr:hypothetical protein [Candidatus Baltobacteraceae bacterium]
MIPALTTNERRSIARAAVATCVVSLLLLPLAVPPRTSAGPARGSGGAVRGLPGIPPPLTYPKLEIRHDPFLRPKPANADDDDALPADLVLPPNAGIASPPHLQALILGAEPKALVEVDGRTAIVGVGTKLEGAAIVGIDARGIELDNGQRLGLEGRNP